MGFWRVLLLDPLCYYIGTELLYTGHVKATGLEHFFVCLCLSLSPLLVVLKHFVEHCSGERRQAGLGFEVTGK